MFGENDEIELQDDERRGLEACPGVTLVTVPDATHMVQVDQPGRTAELVTAAVAAARRSSDWSRSRVINPDRPGRPRSSRLCVRAHGQRSLPDTHPSAFVARRAPWR